MDQQPVGGVHAAAAEPGLYLGKYRVVEEVGRGGMGVVYRAVDEQLRRQVALKSPLPAHASAEDRHRLLQEARAASRVAHPQIVPIYEVFETDDRPWIAMEFVPGQTLRAELNARGPLPVEEVLLIGEQLGDALDAAHEGGVLHGDLNPNNVMLTPRGGARLMDFGLARLLTVAVSSPSDVSTASFSVSDAIRGTLGYISPEQILGRPPDASSDLFSLGAVLYEASTGHRPFQGAAPGEILDATLHVQPPPLAQLRRGLPPELDRIIAKALARRRDERYQSAREMVGDLRALRRRLESQDRIDALDFRTRPRWSLTAAIVVALTAVTAVAVWYATRSSNQIVLGVPRQLTTAPGWEAEPKVSPDGTLVAYSSDQSGNAEIWLLDVTSGASLRLTDDPAPDRSPTWFPDGSMILFVSERRGRPSIWKAPRLGGPAVMVIDDAEYPAVSPDGSSIAFARRDASGFLRIGIASLANVDQSRVLTNSGDGLWDHRQPAWSPDGRSIVYAAWRDLWAVSVNGSGSRRLTFEDAADMDPAWSPGGRFIYFSSLREGTRALWRGPAAGGRAMRLTGGHGPEVQPSVSSNRSRLVYSTYVNTSNLVLRDIATRKEQVIKDERTARSPIFSPDGRSMAYTSDRWAGRVDLWLQPLESGRPMGEPRRLTDHPGSVAQPAFSPDGRWIAYYRVTEGQRDVWVVPIDGGAAFQFTTDPAIDGQPDWSPDGRQLVFVSTRSGTQQIWTQPIANGKPAGAARQVTPAGNQPGAGAPTWSPDGSLIAFVRDSDVWVIAPDGRAPARKLTQGADAVRVCWDRSSGMLWASGFWDGDVLSLRMVDLDTGVSQAPAIPVVLSGDIAASDFDLSRDGRVVAFARGERRGDVWMHEASPNTF